MRLFRPADYTLLVVADDDDDARLLARVLDQERYPVVRARAALAALETIRASQPALCLIDVALPDASGLELCRRLRADRRLWRMPIVLLSARGAETDRVAGFESGADDYVVKPFSVPELLLRLRARLSEVPAPKSTEPSDVLCYGLLEVHPEAFRVRVAGQAVPLSAQEFRLLLALLHAGGEVLSRQDLETSSSGRGGSPSRAVDSHIKRLRRKLGPAAQYIQTIRSLGYRFTSP
ncbi:MAG TPA: response regulator transcription factor [Polyangia bacterium]|nr:response regulator transcription factor [Polyangia bacterium]